MKDVFKAISFLAILLVFFSATALAETESYTGEYRIGEKIKVTGATGTQWAGKTLTLELMGVARIPNQEILNVVLYGPSNELFLTGHFPSPSHILLRKDGIPLLKESIYLEKILLKSNPATSSTSASRTISEAPDRLLLKEQSFSKNGWKIKLNNITGRSLGEFQLTSVSEPFAGNEKAYIQDGLLEPEQSTEIQTTGTFDETVSYTTEISVRFNDGDFTRTIIIQCKNNADSDDSSSECKNLGILQDTSDTSNDSYDNVIVLRFDDDSKERSQSPKKTVTETEWNDNSFRSLAARLLKTIDSLQQKIQNLEERIERLEKLLYSKDAAGTAESVPWIAGSQENVSTVTKVTPSEVEVSGGTKVVSTNTVSVSVENGKVLISSKDNPADKKEISLGTINEALWKKIEASKLAQAQNFEIKPQVDAEGKTSYEVSYSVKNMTPLLNLFIERTQEKIVLENADLEKARIEKEGRTQSINSNGLETQTATGEGERS